MDKKKGAKAKVLDKKKMHKVHDSTEYCTKCGEKTSHMVRHESGHRSHHHESEGPKELY